jgi:hypothetical protein
VRYPCRVFGSLLITLITVVSIIGCRSTKLVLVTLLLPLFLHQQPLLPRCGIQQTCPLAETIAVVPVETVEELVANTDGGSSHTLKFSWMKGHQG